MGSANRPFRDTRLQINSSIAEGFVARHSSPKDTADIQSLAHRAFQVAPDLMRTLTLIANKQYLETGDPQGKIDFMKGVILTVSVLITQREVGELLQQYGNNAIEPVSTLPKDPRDEEYMPRNPITDPPIYGMALEDYLRTVFSQPDDEDMIN